MQFSSMLNVSPSRTIFRRLLLAIMLGFFVPCFAIERVPVESSNLKSVGYDPKQQILEIQFHHGGIYRYFDVPVAIHEALVKSESKGKYFQANIRSKFRFERIDKKQ